MYHTTEVSLMKQGDVYLSRFGVKCVQLVVPFACVDVDTATCRDCASGTCPNSILPNILNEKKLTSGYMGIFSAAKPKGRLPVTNISPKHIQIPH